MIFLLVIVDDPFMMDFVGSMLGASLDSVLGVSNSHDHRDRTPSRSIVSAGRSFVIGYLESLFVQFLYQSISCPVSLVYASTSAVEHA